LQVFREENRKYVSKKMHLYIK
jgi:hypothetical protein